MATATTAQRPLKCLPMVQQYCYESWEHWLSIKTKKKMVIECDWLKENDKLYSNGRQQKQKLRITHIIIQAVAKHA